MVFEISRSGAIQSVRGTRAWERRRPAGEFSAQRATRRRDGGAPKENAFPPATLGQSLRPLAHEHSRLVHQPPALVGASDSGVDETTDRGGKMASTSFRYERAWTRRRTLLFGRVRS